MAGDFDRDAFDDLRAYCGVLRVLELDAKIRGIPFERQKELDMMEAWASSILDHMDNEEDEE